MILSSASQPPHVFLYDKRVCPAGDKEPLIETYVQYVVARYVCTELHLHGQGKAVGLLDKLCDVYLPILAEHKLLLEQILYEQESPLVREEHFWLNLNSHASSPYLFLKNGK